MTSFAAAALCLCSSAHIYLIFHISFCSRALGTSLISSNPCFDCGSAGAGGVRWEQRGSHAAAERGGAQCLRGAGPSPRCQSFTSYLFTPHPFNPTPLPYDLFVITCQPSAQHCSYIQDGPSHSYVFIMKTCLLNPILPTDSEQGMLYSNLGMNLALQTATH